MASGKARSSPRIGRLVPELPADTANHVVIVRVEHRPADGSSVLSEVLLFGAQPHQQGHPGPVKRLASPYRGVSFHSCTQRWRSRIKCGSKSEHLGYFTSDLEAAKAYNDAARKIHGVNAQLNEGVELCLTDGAPVVSTVLSTSKMPYDGLTFYTEQPCKERKPSSPRGGAKKADEAAVVVPLDLGLVVLKKEEPDFDLVHVVPQEEEEELSVVSEPDQQPVPVLVPIQPPLPAQRVQGSLRPKAARKPKGKMIKTEPLATLALEQMDMDVDSQLQGGQGDDDDVFLNYWFNQESLIAIDEMFLHNSHVGSGCGGKRERDSFFSLGGMGMGMEAKRIQC
jgi:hypothetical protein